MTISKYEKFVTVREFAKFTMEQAGKGKTLAELTVDYNTIAMHNGFDFLIIAKPGRVAKLVELMEHVLKRLDAMPEYAERVPEVSDKKAADHLVHASWLKGQLSAHGIDPQDFDAALAWCVGNGSIVPRYWISIYVDYIYCPDCAVTPEEAELLANGDYLPEELFGAKVKTCYAHSERTVIALCGAPVVKGTQIHQQIERLIVTGQQAGLLRADGYTGELEIVDVMPGLAPRTVQLLDMAKAIDANMGWRAIESDQQARALLTQACNVKPVPSNKLPRGKAARRMLSLGWVFNH